MPNNPSIRIGLLGIAHESNTFIAKLTTFEDFTKGHLYFGDEIVSEYQNAHHEIGGIIGQFDKSSIEFVPIMYAEATPGGRISSQAADYLMKMMVQSLTDALPLAGLMVVPHGAAVSESQDDFDGYWLTRVRSIVGNIPVVGTLDLHANVSQTMASAVNVLVPYATNPHVDQRATGERAAEIMLAILADDLRPVQRLLSSKVVIGIEQQYTSSEPCQSLYQLADQMAGYRGVWSIGVVLGFPYADVHDMGTSFLIVTDGDPNLAEQVGADLEQYLIKQRQSFVGEKTSVSDAIKQLSRLSKPVLLLDMGDNVGGGSPGDGTILLQALEESPYKSFVCIFDPEAVIALEAVQPSQRVSLEIGGHTDNLHGSPIQLDVQLISVVDGHFQEPEPRHGGQVHFNMGKTAIVKTRNSTTLMLTSRRIAPFSLQQLLRFGIKPSEFDVIVAKGVQAPIAAYKSVCPSYLRVNTPGVTTADLAMLNYKKRRRPLFPFEEIHEET